VYEREIVLVLDGRLGPEPLQPSGTELLPGPGRHLGDLREHRGELRLRCGELGQRSGPVQHLVGVAHDAPPSKLTDPIDDRCRAGAGIGEVPAMQDDVWPGLREIGDDRLKRGQAAMDV
jgi:hypothetical protein